MQCVNPMFAFAVPYREDGIFKHKIFFNSPSMLKSKEYRNAHVFSIYELPCGKCICCRENKAREWALRLKCESYLHDVTSFITLTYDDDHLPAGGNLNYKDVQLFLKRLRKSQESKIRFFCAGEYGSTTSRPHYHLIVYNYMPSSARTFSQSESGTLYTSESLSSYWGLGNAVFSRANTATMLYTARYAVKKLRDENDAKNGVKNDVKNNDKKDLQKVPEFCRMSLRPGIGYNFLSKYQDDFKSGYLVDNNCRFSIPRYFRKKLVEDFSSDFQSIFQQNINYTKLK